MSYTAKKWTPEEVNKAVELFKKGKDYKYISDKIDGRSMFAIQCKLESYIYEKINNDTSYKSLGKEFGKTEEELKKMFESQMKRNQEKNGAGKTNVLPSASTTQTYQAAPNTAYGLVNRIMTPYIEYHSNLEKLESLKTNKTISSSTYKEIKKILDNINIDDNKFLNQLKITVETKRINPVKSDSKTSESDNSSDESENEGKDKEPTIVIPRKRLF
jgi:major membrane immunogen (membrane-anchored lipoprotein)